MSSNHCKLAGTSCKDGQLFTLLKVLKPVTQNWGHFYMFGSCKYIGTVLKLKTSNVFTAVIFTFLNDKCSISAEPGNMKYFFRFHNTTFYLWDAKQISIFPGLEKPSNFSR